MSYARHTIFDAAESMEVRGEKREDRIQESEFGMKGPGIHVGEYYRLMLR